MSHQTRRGVLAGVGGGTVAALLGGTGTGLAAEQHGDSGGGLAAFKIAHMAPEAPNVDVYANGVPIEEDVSFKSVSQNHVGRSGEYHVQITPAGGDLDSAVVDAEVELGQRAYTAIATGEVSGENRPFYPLVHPTNLGPLDEGMARIRAFHLSPDAPRVDVAPEGGDPLFTGVGYTQNRTADVPAGEYTLELRPAGTEDVVTTFDVALVPGAVHTAYVVGYAAPDEDPADEPLDLVRSIDGTTPSLGGR